MSPEATAERELEDVHRRMVQLRMHIERMDEVNLACLSSLLVVGSCELIRQAMLYAVGFLSVDELMKWEEIANHEHANTNSSAASRHHVSGATKTVKSPRARRALLPKLPDFAIPELSDFAVPEEDTDECGTAHGYEWVESALEFDSGTWEVQEFEIEIEAPPSCEPDACHGGFDVALDFPIPKDLLPQLTIPAARQIFGLPQVSQGHWLAVTQELKMKEFAIRQMDRQLDFERRRADWLMSEIRWRERRECHISSFTQGGFVDELALENGLMAVNDSLGEDHRVQDSYASNSSSFWSVEASWMEALCSEIHMESIEDHSLSESDRLEYYRHLTPAFRGLRKSFKSRRFQADQHQCEALQQIQKHHDKVRSRHLRALSGVSDLASSGRVNSDSRTEDSYSDSDAASQCLLAWNEGRGAR